MIVNRKQAEEAWALLVTTAVNDPMEVYSDWPNLDGTCEEAVKSAYKSAARKAHPDMETGSAEKFAAVDRAKHVLLKWLERQAADGPPKLKAEQCTNCGGKGYVERQGQRGFKVTTLRVQCRRCNGTGEEGVEHDRGDWG